MMNKSLSTVRFEPPIDQSQDSDYKHECIEQTLHMHILKCDQQFTQLKRQLDLQQQTITFLQRYIGGGNWTLDHPQQVTTEDFNDEEI